MRWTAAGLVLGTMLVCGGTAGAVADPIDDTFEMGLTHIDITDLSACQTPTSLVLRMTFAEPIVPGAGDGPPPAGNALYGYIDLDLDGDAATGSTSKVEEYGPGGAGTEIGSEAEVNLTQWDSATQTLALETTGTGASRVPAVFGTNTLTVTVPRTASFAAVVHVGAVIGNFSEPTDVAPNTGFVASGSCCGNGFVDAGEECDGGGCCTSTCEFDDGAACTDGDVCTTSDTCSAGECVGSTRDCSDGDPCFDDTCEQTSGCAHTDRTGFPGVACAFERTLPTLCSGQTLATVKLDKAESQLAEAASTTSAGKRKKLVKKARKSLKAMRKVVDKAQKKKALTIECADGVRAQLDDIAVRLDRALAGG
jgi:hypothetical protein